jgi:hypothetical protein
VKAAQGSLFRKFCEVSAEKVHGPPRRQRFVAV